MSRKPDYVFNVWGDGMAIPEHPPFLEAADMARTNRVLVKSKYRITHRIRVFLKNKDEKK